MQFFQNSLIFLGEVTSLMKQKHIFNQHKIKQVTLMMQAYVIAEDCITNIIETYLRL